MHNDWKDILSLEVEKDYFKKIKSFLVEETNKGKIIYPSKENIYRVFNMSPRDIKVVIIGQDPYFNPGEAHGLCFSVQDGVKVPVSLKNIYKEIESQLKIKKDFTNGNLSSWEEQGVFLINSFLTVEHGIQGSHSKCGWGIFTDFVIKYISDNFNDKVFLLWGSHAKTKLKLINTDKHYVLSSAHPSGLSAYRGFFGNNHFIDCNDFLVKKGIKPINW